MNQEQAIATWIRAFEPSPRPPRTAGWDRADWQRLWLGTQARPWRTLAVVSADATVSTLELARLLAALGEEYGEAMGMADVRDLALGRVGAVLELATAVVAGGARIVFATRSIAENVSTIPIARAADCVLLCVSLGSSRLDVIEETVAQLGKERFLGSVLLRPDPRQRSALAVIPPMARAEGTA